MQIIFCYIRKQASLWQLCRFFGRKTNTGFARHPLPDDVFESFKYTQTDNKQSGWVRLLSVWTTTLPAINMSRLSTRRKLWSLGRANAEDVLLRLV